MKKRIGYRAKDSISEGGATGSWGARAKFKMKKLLKIGEKQSKISSSSKIGEVQTRPVKALQNQKVNKEAKKEVPTSAVVNRISRIYKKKKAPKNQKVTKKDLEQFNEHIAARYAKKAMSEGKKPNYYFLKNKKKILKNQKPTKNK